VGFSGSFIVVRADRPLTGLPALRPPEGKASWHWQGPGGWQAVQIDRGPAGWSSPDLARAWDGLLRGLVRQAGHPVLTAVIQHSEGAQLLGYSPVAGRWGGWIRAEGVAWRSLPEDRPFEYWDEEGNRQFEDDAACEGRHRDALGRLYAAAGPPGSAAAPAAVTWAREAGLQPDPAAVAAALDSDSIFPEDAFLQLLAALGVPDPPTEDDF
jgi:hypothetical protein